MFTLPISSPRQALYLLHIHTDGKEEESLYHSVFKSNKHDHSLICGLIKLILLIKV